KTTQIIHFNIPADAVRRTPARAQPFNILQSYCSRVISIRCTPTNQCLNIQTQLAASLPGQLDKESVAFVTFKRRREHSAAERDLRSIQDLLRNHPAHSSLNRLYSRLVAGPHIHIKVGIVRDDICAFVTMDDGDAERS